MQKELKTGLTALVIFVAFIIGLNFLKGKNFFSNTHHFCAVFSDIDGLQKSNTVILNGMNIGYVDDISMMDGSLSRILVQIEIDRHYTLPRNSELRICSIDMLGTKGVRVVPGDSREAAVPGDTLQTGAEDDLLSSLAGKLAPAADNASETLSAVHELVRRLNAVLDQETQDRVKHIVAGADAFVTEERVRIGEMLSHLEQIAATIHAEEGHIAAILAQADSITGALAQADLKACAGTLTETVGALQTTLAQINAGEGTAGKLIYDEELYHRLNDAVSSLDRLFNDMMARPKDYVQFSVFERKSKVKNAD